MRERDFRSLLCNDPRSLSNFLVHSKTPSKQWVLNCNEAKRLMMRSEGSTARNIPILEGNIELVCMRIQNQWFPLTAQRAKSITGIKI